MTKITSPDQRPSMEMRRSAPGKDDIRAQFFLGRERFLFHGHKAYRMKYPGQDRPDWWKPYRAGIRSAEFNKPPSRELKELLQ